MNVTMDSLEPDPATDENAAGDGTLQHQHQHLQPLSDFEVPETDRGPRVDFQGGHRGNGQGDEAVNEASSGACIQSQQSGAQVEALAASGGNQDCAIMPAVLLGQGMDEVASANSETPGRDGRGGPYLETGGGRDGSRPAQGGQGARTASGDKHEADREAELEDYGDDDEEAEEGSKSESRREAVEDDDDFLPDSHVEPDVQIETSTEHLIMDDPEDEDFDPGEIEDADVVLNGEEIPSSSSSSSSDDEIEQENGNRGRRKKGKDLDEFFYDVDLADDSSTDTSAESSDDEEEEEEEEEVQNNLGEHFLLDGLAKRQMKREEDDDDFTWADNTCDTKPLVKVEGGEDVNGLPAPKRRGRPKKSNTPKPKSVVRVKKEEVDDDDEDEESDEEDWSPRKRKRGRGRPKKERKVVERDEDWDVNQSFTCEKCNESVIGFQEAVDHMDDQHPVSKKDGDIFQCILCSRPFGRKDHLKRHVEGHVDGRIPYGDEAIRLQEEKKIRQQEKKKQTSKKEDWSLFRVFSCYKCEKKVKGFRAAWIHMREAHPWDREKKSISTELSDGEGSEQFYGQSNRRPDSAAKSDRSDTSDNIKNELNEDETEAGNRTDDVKAQEHLSQCQASEDGSRDSIANGSQDGASLKADDVLSEGGKIEGGDFNAQLKEETSPESSLFCFQCIFCPRAYYRRDQLKVHVWRHVNAIEPTPMHSTKGYLKSWAEVTLWSCKKCPDMGDAFAGLSAFIMHHRLEHGHSTGLVCPVCDKKHFTKKDQLKAHVQTHNEVKLPCEFCGKLFADGNKMKRHVNEVHQKLKNYMCNTCGKCFARKDKLRAHESLHIDTDDYKPYLCHICGRGFGRPEHVSRHQKLCGQKQKERQEIMEDEDFEDPNRELQMLSYELGLENYKRDPATGMYKCKECNHQCKERRYIAEHFARNHRIENLKLPYRCEVCGRGYKILKDLLRHKKRPNVHSEENLAKAFECDHPECDRRFHREHELRSHMKIHEGIKEFSCEHCDAAFHMRQSLKTHMKSVHDLILPRAPRRRKNAGSGKGFLKDSKSGKRIRKRKRRPEEDDEDFLNSDSPGRGGGDAERAASASGALNLTSSNHPSTSANVDQWVPQGYFGQHNVTPGQAQFPSFAHWMSVGLDQQNQLSQTSSNLYSPGIGGQNNNNTAMSSSSVTNVNNDDDSVRSFTPSSRHRESPVSDRHPTIGQGENDTEQRQVSNEREGNVSDWATWGNAESRDNDAKKRRKNQGAPMTDEERLKYEEAVTEKKLGAFCSVCGKVFRNKDALDFHIMTTKMPGHGLLQEQRMKSHYAYASMQVSARLKEASRPNEMKPDIGDVKEPTESSSTDPGPTQDENNEASTVTPSNEKPAVENNETGPFIDPKTGECKVKQEPRFEDDQPSDEELQQETGKENRVGMTNVNEMPLAVSIKTEPGIEDCFKKPFDLPPDNKVLLRKKFGKNKIFKCMECQKGFKKQKKLIKHVMKRHKESLGQQKQPVDTGADIHELTKNGKDADGRWPCVICGKSLANKQKLQRHIMEVHQRLRHHVCRICKKGFARAEKLKQHEYENHDEEELKKIKPVPVPTLPIPKKEPLFKNGPQLRLVPMGCLDCELEFTDKDELMEHMRGPPHYFELAEEITCPIMTCNLRFSSLGRLVQHLRVGKHNQPCPSCGKKFKRLDKLEIHLRCHSSDRPFTCNMCDKSYKDPTSLQFHKKTHTGARPYLCTDCGTGFMKPDHLRRHINSTHLRIKNIKCQFCDMLFFDKYKARIHERKHTGECPYLCSICAKAFKRKEALDQHAIVHKDLPRDFKCVTCSATFKSQQYLNRHVSRHFAERRWQCPKCPSAFIDKRDLVTHDKHVHQNLRPFICEYCGSAYKTKQGLQIHMKSYPTGDCVHMKRFSGRGANRIDLSQMNEPEEPDDGSEKPFECNECHKRFSKKSRLEWHTRMHANVRPFPCTVEGCNRSFTQNQTLRAHLKQFHQMELPSLPRGGGGGVRKKLAPSVSPAPPVAATSPVPDPRNGRGQPQLPAAFSRNVGKHSGLGGINPGVPAISAPDQQRRSVESVVRSPIESPVSFDSSSRIGTIASKIASSKTPEMPARDMHQGVHQAPSRHLSGGHTTPDMTPQFLLQQQQLFQQQQQQQQAHQQQQQPQHQHQQQQRPQLLQQHQQLQPPLGLHHNQMNAFAGMISEGRDNDGHHHAVGSHPSPLDFYQYAANFANSMYRN